MLTGGDHRAGGVVDRSGAVHPLPGRQDAAGPVQSAAAQAGQPVRALACQAAAVGRPLPGAGQPDRTAAARARP
ncbi:hypothetical protein G6F50_018038 [Rhizopus delemar]|uniref:Uncharacterized protein n=1 Tax=Rhizopus delemar TaxID=936053 RepID=A0A9P6XNX8_9FUNG|nr:hypothetical protein G6F24_018539 [Rhizopus arrhizus]KAG1529383.1 hypothetical protein G6F50_018038 [Rhizopus delemar]